MAYGRTRASGEAFVAALAKPLSSIGVTVAAGRGVGDAAPLRFGIPRLTDYKPSLEG